MTTSQSTGGPKRRGLGRGLDALLTSTATAARPDATDPTAEAHDDEARLASIDPHRVAPNPEQPRTTFDPDEMEALNESVRMHGVLQPIVVERRPDGTYQLIAGERRLRAAQNAGLSSLPAIIRPATESARHALELALTENLVRADLSAIEEAVAYSRLADAFGLSHEVIAIRVGRSRAAISNTVRLLSLPARVQEALRTGSITAGHARALLAVTDTAALERLAQRIPTEQLSVRQVERAVQALLEGASTPGTGGPARHARTQQMAPDEAALQHGFEEAVGAPVTLERRRTGGRLVIEFHNDEELDGLYRRLGGPPL